MHNLPFPIIRAAERRSNTGWILCAAGGMSIFGLVLLWIVLVVLIAEVNAFLEFVLGLGIFAPFYVAALPRLENFILRGRKMRAPCALDILSKGNRAPVVLLWSFDDHDLIDPSFQATYQIAPGRYEDRLVKALRPIGPAVALGRQDCT